MITVNGKAIRRQGFFYGIGLGLSEEFLFHLFGRRGDLFGFHNRLPVSFNCQRVGNPPD
jgi:hypothetical protein